jgi:RNA recognition motif-containing protein
MLMPINNAEMKGKILISKKMNDFFINEYFYCSVVEFASSSDMKAALDKLDDTDLNGRRIRLVEDRGRSGGRGSRRSRSSSRSRSRSRSRRGSRSR